MGKLDQLKQTRLAELRAMGQEGILRELERAKKAGWKSDKIVLNKIRLHQREWGREDMTVEEFRRISQHTKDNPASRIFTYIHDVLPHHRGYYFISPQGEVIHYRVDEDLNKSCYKPKDLAKYLRGRKHWIEIDREGRIL
ncbi:MAG TPA: hypothetical protein EYP49_17000 [Anaerolineae bacterium]|nr:hypothetical protein [Anaerolineae bacterium]